MNGTPLPNPIGTGDAGPGEDREIVAFHPGEAFIQANRGPLDDWTDAKYDKPEAGKLVSGWTGRFMCKCIFDHARGIWVTNKGTAIKVVMWKKE